MRHARISLALLTVLFALASTSGIFATSYVVIPDAPLADQADLIVIAKVANQKVSSETGRVMTHYTVLVEDLIKGDVPGSGLEVRVLGGIDPEIGHFLKIWGSPQFRTGETVLLFLGANDDGSYHAMHMLLGVFHRMRSGGQSFWVRSLEDAHVIDVGIASASSAPVNTERDGELFVEWLRDRAGGSNRDADYFREVPENTSFVSQFTLLADGDDPIVRWFAFDDDKKVVIRRHRAGHKAVPTKGKRQLKGAVAILNKVKDRSGAPLIAEASAIAKPNISLKVGSKTGKKGGFDTSDNQNVFYGSDLGDWIADDFDCSTGGVLAVGGVSFIFTQDREFRGVQAISTAETELVINDNTACFYKGEGVWAAKLKPAEEVYLHELLHTLGVGHSCGDDSSPKCGKSALANDANMRATVHGDGDHAMGLGRDDIAALQFLYTDDPHAPVPSGKKIPGSKKFCKKIKGCGEGQGNCKNNKQCNGDLVCTRNVGDSFGLPPATDVCTSP
jgi:hypothetical protein